MELIQLLNSYSFFISNDLTEMVNFPTRMPDCDSCSPVLLDLFISSDTIVFALQWLSSIGKFWSCCCLRCHWLCSKLKMGSPFSLHSLWLFPCWLGQSSWSFERCSIEGYLLSVFLLLLVNFVSEFRLELKNISLI